jgi:uncharacterized integral membrane protein
VGVGRGDARARSISVHAAGEAVVWTYDRDAWRAYVAAERRDARRRVLGRVPFAAGLALPLLAVIAVVAVTLVGSAWDGGRIAVALGVVSAVAALLGLVVPATAEAARFARMAHGQPCLRFDLLEVAEPGRCRSLHPRWPDRTSVEVVTGSASAPVLRFATAGPGERPRDLLAIPIPPGREAEAAAYVVRFRDRFPSADPDDR